MNRRACREETTYSYRGAIWYVGDSLINTGINLVHSTCTV